MNSLQPEQPSPEEPSALWPSSSTIGFSGDHLAPAGSVEHQIQPSSDQGRVNSDRINVDNPAKELKGTEESTSDRTNASIEPDAEKANYEGDVGFEPIKTKSNKERRYDGSSTSIDKITEDLFKVVSRKRTNASGRQGSYISSSDEEQVEIERLMSRMFGTTRQENSEDEKSRHVGLVFKNLSVKGKGLGAALQPTLSDLFLGLPRRLKLGKGATLNKPPIRTILNNITGCIRPGEMLLVLGKPGSGCSTFLKALANQRFGYESVEGEVTYGGTDAKIMAKDYRGEIVYNPEEDLHYATLSVKRTLAFALKTRTPGKASRKEGESRSDYVREFLRVVAKLFWIEHTVRLPPLPLNSWGSLSSDAYQSRQSIRAGRIGRGEKACFHR